MEIPEFSLDVSMLERSRVPESGKMYDMVIVGGGPAAMSAAVYASRKMLSLALLTKDFGGQVGETSQIENWLGFQSINGRELAQMFQEHVTAFDIPVKLGVKVSGIEKDGDAFGVFTENGELFRGRSVVFSTGKRHRGLNVPGEKELVGRGVAYCATCDAPYFRGKPAVVAGGGNSAFTTALDLIKVNASVTMVNFVKGWQADGALKKRVEEDNVRLLDYHEITRIEGSDRVEAVIVKDRKTAEEMKLETQGVFVEIGLLPNSGPVKGLADLNDSGEMIVDCACRSSVEGLFGSGDVTTVPHKQIIIAAGEGAKAALSAYAYLVEKGVA